MAPPEVMYIQGIDTGNSHRKPNGHKDPARVSVATSFFAPEQRSSVLHSLGYFNLFCLGLSLHISPLTSAGAIWPSVTGPFHNSIPTLAPPPFFIQNANSLGSNVLWLSCTLDVDCQLDWPSIHSCSWMCLLMLASMGMWGLILCNPAQ